jgi:hypothetical protein
MDKILSFLFGGGWWLVWYALLWAAVAPSLALAFWLLRAPTLAGQHPGGISTLQGLAIVPHPLIVPASVALDSQPFDQRTHEVPAGRRPRTPAVVLRARFMFAAWWSIDGLNTPRAQRAASILLMIATSVVLHGFNLYAAWSLRAR